MLLKNRPIGVFDSGLGGLTAVSELKKVLPNEDIIYLGDTARIPYGTKSRETVLRYAVQDYEFLKKFDVKFLIVACGTASSVMLGESVFDPRLCTGVIAPAADAAVKSTKSGKIGVIATGASIKIGGYERLILEKMPEAKVYSKACPMFVPLVENGYTSPDCGATMSFAREYLEPLRDEGIDTLILGCTHYPLLSERELEKSGLLTDRSDSGGIKMFCTDSPELFRENAAHFIALDGITVERCEVEG